MRHKVYVTNMKWLRNTYTVTRMNRWMKKEEGRRVEVSGKMSDRLAQKVLKQLGGIERISGEWLTKKV